VAAGVGVSGVAAFAVAVHMSTRYQDSRTRAFIAQAAVYRGMVELAVQQQLLKNCIMGNSEVE
jgi:hypothetical protein